MKKNILLLTALILLAATTHVNSASLYHLHDLGTMGFNRSQASSINNHGVIVGMAIESPDPMVQALAFRWENGKSKFLYYDSPAVTDYTSASSINDNNEIVGAGKRYEFRSPGPIMWHSDGRYEIVPAPYFGSATDINNNSTITTFAGNDIDHGFYENGDWHALQPDAPYWGSAPNAINDLGQIVGGMNSDSAEQSLAFLFENGTIFNLNDLITNGYSGHLGTAVDINQAGQIIGGDYLFDNGEVIALGFSDATAINDKGQIVGGHYLYESGQLLDLNTLVQSDVIYGGLNLVDLNNKGQMVGSASINGVQHAVLLDPVPVPPALWLMGSGLISMACLRSRFQRHRREQPK
jgi:probable HAF family extracellular repeat protein